MARERRSSGCSRIWRTTMRMRIALITYTFMFMSLPCRFTPAGASAHGWDRGFIAAHPWVDRLLLALSGAVIAAWTLIPVGFAWFILTSRPSSAW